MIYANAHVVTMDDDGTELADGWFDVEDGFVTAVGAGEPPPGEREDLGGAVVTPGLANTHHHLYQTLTRARAQQADLFTWLRELYPVRAGIDAEAEYAAACGLHDRLRPPLRLPARSRRAGRGRGRGCPAAGRAHRRLARIDGSGPVAGWAAAG